MIINLHKPFSISEVGQRINNEDSTYPKNEDVSVNDKLFLVCDGVGGASKGEIASYIACESIQTYFNTFLEPGKNIDAQFIEKAIRYTEIRFDEYIQKNPESKGMATTMCLLYFSHDGVFIAHAGDSRIYQIREGEIIFCTEDHSLVNSLVKTGQIRADDARHHPQKNVIYRAIQGSEHPVEIDVIQLFDILSGDQFLMCTDGIYETTSDSQLCEILSEKGNAQSKLIKIKEICVERAKDNYSAYLIPIQDIQTATTFNQIFASFVYALM